MVFFGFCFIVCFFVIIKHSVKTMKEENRKKDYSRLTSSERLDIANRMEKKIRASLDGSTDEDFSDFLIEVLNGEGKTLEHKCFGDNRAKIALWDYAIAGNPKAIEYIANYFYQNGNLVTWDWHIVGLRDRDIIEYKRTRAEFFIRLRNNKIAKELMENQGYDLGTGSAAVFIDNHVFDFEKGTYIVRYRSEGFLDSPEFLEFVYETSKNTLEDNNRHDLAQAYAAVALAMMYYYKTYVKLRDYDEAYKYFEFALQKFRMYLENIDELVGNLYLVTLYLMAEMNEKGHGVKRDFQKAGDLYLECGDFADADSRLDKLYTSRKWSKNNKENDASQNKLENNQENYLRECLDKAIRHKDNKDYDEAVLNIRHILEVTLNYYTQKYIPEFEAESMYEQIEELSRLEILSKNISKIYHDLRIIANKGAHKNNENEVLTEEDVSKAIQLCPQIIDLYIEG